MRAIGVTAVRETGSGAPSAMSSTTTDRGASTVEYGLIVFAIAATIVMAVVALGPQVYGLFDGTCQAVRGGVANNGGTPPACT